MQNIGKILIYIAGLCWGIELIPQLVKTYKRKKVSDISLCFFSLCLFAYICWITGSILEGYWDMVIAHTPSLILTFWMWILILRYRK